MSRSPASIHELETPALLVEGARLEKNLEEMAGICRQAGVRLRPHVKTHKCVEIARMQVEGGACGFTSAKVSEAGVFAAAGIDDILVAYPLVGSRPRALLDLAERTGARVSTVADSRQGVEDLSAAWSGAPEPLEVLVKIDTGLGRVGVPVEDEEAVFALAHSVREAPGLRLGGVLTHAGHAYGAGSPAEVAEIGRREGEDMVSLAGRLGDRGLEVETVSVGSTPTARHAVAVPGVTELRPGNYVFYDGIQVSLGTAGLDRCALTVWTTVVSRAAADRAACDAGSKVFSSDRGAHGSGSGDHGVALGEGGGADPGLRLARLSEEHGWLRVDPGHPLAVGRRLRIVPAHACAAVNLARRLWVVEGERVVDCWPVAASGCVA